MDKDWSEKNKEIQKLFSKEATFKEAVQKLIEFRKELFQQITWIVEGYPEKAFFQMPFAGVKGYHSKTLAYSIYLRIVVIAFDRKTHFYQIIQYLFCGADGNIKGDKML
jgi:hypothetical protein